MLNTTSIDRSFGDSARSGRRGFLKRMTIALGTLAVWKGGSAEAKAKSYLTPSYVPPGFAFGLWILTGPTDFKVAPARWPFGTRITDTRKDLTIHFQFTWPPTPGEKSWGLSRGQTLPTLLESSSHLSGT
jgi:hypothetical protein